MGRYKRLGTNQVLSVLLIAVMLACAGVIGSQMFSFPTLLIINKSMEPVRVYSEFGMLGNVFPGEKKCVRLRELGDVKLRLRQLSEGNALVPVFNVNESPGWEITIRNLLRIDVHTLRPAEACK